MTTVTPARGPGYSSVSFDYGGGERFMPGFFERDTDTGLLCRFSDDVSLF